MIVLWSARPSPSASASCIFICKFDLPTERCIPKPNEMLGFFRCVWGSKEFLGHPSPNSRIIGKPQNCCCWMWLASTGCPFGNPIVELGLQHESPHG